MVTLNTLVVFYPGIESSVGPTRRAASRIARSLRADTEELVFRKGRGFFETLRWSIEDALGWPSGIDSVRKDPARYDLVIVGTPIGSLPEFAPVRSYLFLFHGKMSRVAFFCTTGGASGVHACRQMETLSGSRALASMSLRNEEVERGDYLPKVDRFVNAVRLAATERLELAQLATLTASRGYEDMA